MELEEKKVESGHLDKWHILKRKILAGYCSFFFYELFSPYSFWQHLKASLGSNMTMSIAGRPNSKQK